MLAGARSQVSAAHCAETRLHFVLSQSQGICEETVVIYKKWWPPGDARKGTLDTFRLFAKSDKQTAVIYSVLGHCTGPPPVCIPGCSCDISLALARGGSGGGGAGRQLGTTLRCRGWGTPSCSQARMGMETGARDQEYVVAAPIYWDQSLA